MHIAYVTADRGIPVFGAKGASIHVREMVSALAVLGHEVTLLAARRGPASCPLPAEIIKINTEIEQPMTLLEGADKARMRERHAMANSEAIEAALAELHQRKPIDMIYERYCLFSTAGTRAARRHGIPLALEVNSPLRLEQQRYRTLIHDTEARAVEHEVFGHADAVFAVSAEVRDYTISRGARNSHAYILPNGVDCERFSPEVPPEPFAEASKDFVVGFVGSLKPWHGIESLMQAFRAMALDDAGCHLMIVGDGPLRSWIEGYACGAGIEHRVTITGWAEYDRLPALLTAMDVAVAPYPALEDFYFSPLKLYEYMAAGLPVIASDIGQISTVIQHRSNGYLVPPGDVDRLVTALQHLRSEASLRRDLGQRARHCAGQRTWQDNARQVIETLWPSATRTEAAR